MKNSFKERFRYWFDQRMSKGTVSMIKMLGIVTLLIVIVITIIITASGMDDEGGFLATFWDSLATVINAWMPYSDDGGAGYVILTAIVAIVGLLFTSVLIGIVGSAIEDKLTELRKGNSVILEKGHTVILGHTPGAYELINQLIIAADGKPLTIVIAEELEKDEMEDAIRENIEIPKNVNIICRNADITYSSALQCCTLPMAKIILINPMDNQRTVKTVLAAESVLRNAGAENVKIVAAVSRDEYLLPGTTHADAPVIMLQTNDIIARIMAHSCSQPGLSEAFTEIFDFNGAEFYLNPFPEGEGLDFETLSERLQGGVPVGLERNGEILLPVNSKEVLRKGEKLLFFAEGRESIHLMEPDAGISSFADNGVQKKRMKKEEKITVIGYNEVFSTIVRELPPDTAGIILSGVSGEDLSEAEEIFRRRPEIPLEMSEGNPDEQKDLEALARKTDHFLLLCDHEAREEEADIRNMLLLLRLRDIKKQLGLKFTVTTELHSEKNRLLVATKDPTDFIVAGNMSSMILAEMAESPELYNVFKELLANEGTDLCLKLPEEFGLLGKEVTTGEIRAATIRKGYIFLGILKNNVESRETYLNPGLREKFTPDEDDTLIVIGEQ